MHKSVQVVLGRSLQDLGGCQRGDASPLEGGEDAPAGLVGRVAGMFGFPVADGARGLFGSPTITTNIFPGSAPL